MCWTTRAVKIGHSMVTTNDKGKKLKVTRVHYTADGNAQVGSRSVTARFACVRFSSRRWSRCALYRNAMPRIDAANPARSTGTCQRGSVGLGHAIIPSSRTLTIETA